MKLTSNYTPDQHKIPENQFYNAFQEAIIKGVEGPCEFVQSKSKNHPDKYEYTLADDEKFFFESLYSPHGKTINDNPGGETLAIEYDLDKEKTSTHIKDFIEFLTPQINICFLIGPVGIGKTVLLRYFSLFLFDKESGSELLRKKVIPILMTVDTHKSQFDGAKNSKKIKSIFFSDILEQPITNVVSDITRVDNEKFWKYVKDESGRYNTLSDQEKDLISIYNGEELNAEIKKARKEVKRDKDIIFVALQFLKTHQKRTPLLILDNIDILHADTIKILYDEVVRISQNFGIKFIISLREITYKQLKENNEIYEAYPSLKSFVREERIKNYLEKRTKYIIKLINEKPIELKPSDEATDIRKITLLDAKRAYEAMLNSLIDTERSEIISNLSGHNRRKANALLTTYLSSGYINEEKILQNYIEGNRENEESIESPMWVLLSSLITNNHATRFSQNETYEGKANIQNLYCNGTHQNENYHFVRLHILNYLNNRERVKVEDLYKKYTELFIISKKAFYYAIYRLIRSETIESPELYLVGKPKDIRFLKEISITSVGKYYINTFRNYFEYILYIKDDVDLGDNEHGIKSCIEVTKFLDRFEEVIKFLNYLYSKEEELFKQLDDIQKLQSYYNKFRERTTNSFSFVSTPVDKLLAFAQSKSDSYTSIEELKKTDQYNQIVSELSKLQKTIKKDDELKKQRLGGDSEQS